MTLTQQTAILIVGMHRSGTSALAGVLSKLGIPLGDRLLQPAEDNPKGYWEHKDVVAAHDRLLEELGSRWDDVRALPDDWLRSESARRTSLTLGDIIAKDFSDKPVWCVKDPRLCRLLPLWLEVLRQRDIRPVVLFVVRNPREVSASIETRNHWRPVVGKMLWLRYMTEALEATPDMPRSIVLYDDLLLDPVSTVTAAMFELGISIGSDLSAKEHEVITSFVDSSDRHHTATGFYEANSAFDSITQEIYESLAAIAHGVDRWQKIEQATTAFRREWTENGTSIDAMADMAFKIEADAHAYKVENYHLNSALKAQIQWSEEARAKHEVLQAENAELSSKLTAQVRWSEAAAAKHEALQEENTELSSKLTAQIRWSENAQKKYENLQAEHAELLTRMNDKIQECEYAMSHFEELKKVSHDLSEKLQKTVRELEQSRSIKSAVDAELQKVYQSKSWKWTKSLRFVSRLFVRNAQPASDTTRNTD